MNISLDYDDTYTRDPDMWDAIIEVMQLRGHQVHIVTMRNPKQLSDPLIALKLKCQVIFTALHAKKEFVARLGLVIDIWIDDNPFFILHDALGVVPYPK